MVLLLLLALGFGPYFGSHSQDWCEVGTQSNLEVCRVVRSGPLVPGRDVTATAPRFGQDFTGIRTQVQPGVVANSEGGAP